MPQRASIELPERRYDSIRFALLQHGWRRLVHQNCLPLPMCVCAMTALFQRPLNCPTLRLLRICCLAFFRDRDILAGLTPFRLQRRDSGLLTAGLRFRYRSHVRFFPWRSLSATFPAHLPPLSNRSPYLQRCSTCLFIPPSRVSCFMYGGRSLGPSLIRQLRRRSVILGVTLASVPSFRLSDASRVAL